jgi:phage-related protein
MAAEIVGTAYVRIKALTAGLASEISDGVEKGVKDADLDKAGKGLGEDLGGSTSESFKGTMTEGLPEGMSEAFDSPEMHKASEEGGESVGKDVTKGVEKEHKRRNPFASMLDALKGLNFKGAFDDVDLPTLDTPEMHRNARESGEKIGDSFGDGVDNSHRRRNPFSFLGSVLRAIVPNFGRNAEDAGQGIGDKVTAGVEKSHKKKNPFTFLADSLAKISLPKPIEWAGIFGPTTLAPIIGTILSLFALVVQGLGFIITAAAGAGVALAGIAAVAAPGLGALFLAFKTQTPQLEKFKKRTKELLKPWEEFGIATQEHLLPGIEDFLEKIQQLIPLFSPFGNHIGQIVGDFFRLAGSVFTSEKNMRALKGILDASEKFFINIRTAVLNVADALLPFLNTAAPLAVKFSDSLAKWAEHLNEFVQKRVQIDEFGVATGTLVDTFTKWYDRFVLLVGIVGDLFVGLWGIFSLASDTPAAGGFFDTLASAAQTFRDWVGSTEGQNKIKKFFEDAQPVLDELWDLLGNVYNLIVAPTVEGDGGSKMFENLAWALGLLNDVLENPITAKVAPYLLSLVVALSLLSAVPDFVTGGIGKAFDKLGGALARFASGLTGIGNAEGIFATFGASLQGFLLGPAAPFILALAAIAVVAGGVYIAFRNWDTIIDWLKQAWEWFTKLEWPLKIVVGILATLVALSPPGALLTAILGITAALKNWDKIAEFVDRLWDSLWEFFTNLPELIGTAIDSLVEFATNLPEKLAPFVEEFIRIFSELPGKLKEGLLAGLEALPGLILDALAGLGTLAQNLLGLIADGLIAAAPTIGEWFIKLPIMILDWVFTAASSIIEIGLKLLMWLLDGLVQALPEVLTFFIKLPIEVATMIRRGIWELIKLGAEMIGALVTGIFDNKGRILDFFKDLPENIMEGLEAAIEFLWNFGKGLIEGMWEGIQEMWPTITSFFSELPGKILDFLDVAWDFLFDIGSKLMNGLWEGINEVWDSIDEFFGELPGKIGGFFKRLPGAVTGALNTFVTTVIPFFIGLPGKIMDALSGLVETIVGVFIDLGLDLLAALPGAFQAVWDWFSGLPQTILDLIIAASQIIIDLGGNIVGWVVEGIEAAAQTLWDWFTGLPQAILDLLTGLKDTILDIGGDILGWIVDGLTGAWHFVSDYISEFPENFRLAFEFYKDKILEIGGKVLEWIKDGLVAAWHFIADYITDWPGNFMTNLTLLKDEILDIGGAVIGWIADGLGKAFETGGAILEWITDLPGEFLDLLNDSIQMWKDIGGDLVGWIVDGLGGLGSAMLNALKGAWNYVAKHFSVTVPIPFADDIKIELPTFKMAMGGVIPGSALGTVVTVGEGGRSEAVVPMTRPSRALAVMQQAGLDKLVLDAYMGGSISDDRSVAGDTTMLRIDTAYINDPVDAQMIVQRVTSAYNRLAS